MLRQTFGSNERPVWFNGSISAVLDGASALLAATGPRELEQLTTELVGAQLYHAIHDVRRHLRFDWWFAELADAARNRLDRALGTDEWRPPFWLLHGLAAIATPALVPKLPSQGFVRSLRADPAPPSWLQDTTRFAATGEVWLMRDACGTRYAVIAAYAYPRGSGQHVLLLDIDAAGFIVLAGVGVFDDVAQAAAAWRDAVGGSAATTQPEPVTDSDQLRCLVQLDPADGFAVRGDEPRSVVDNWFRANRRIQVLHEGMRTARMPLPAATNLYRDIDITVMTRPFTEWYGSTGAVEPNPEAVDALAMEWMEGALPETWFSVSASRVEFQLGLIDDWITDEVTIEVRNLMPSWVRWLGDRANLPGRLLEPAIAAAAPRKPTSPAR
ncbi:MAG: hypothetical protein L0H84_22740 [Pseudonocardia sp.]|nr:hypothetical protein [Pseudonocardia sp.]